MFSSPFWMRKKIKKTETTALWRSRGHGSAGWFGSILLGRAASRSAGAALGLSQAGDGEDKQGDIIDQVI